MSTRILTGDALAMLATLPDASVHMCVTSPPYFGLRDYGTAQWEGSNDLSCDHVVGEIRTGLGLAKLGEQYRGGGHKASEPKPMMARNSCPRCGAVRVDGQMGLEPTLADYIAGMVAVFREVRRVLRPDGTCWINMGDAFAGSWGAQGRRVTESDDPSWHASQIKNHPKRASRTGSIRDAGLKPKDLMMIPARLAIALCDDGWWLRKDIIWHKPNPMPESCTDRPTSSHEHILLLAKSDRYFFDAEAVREIGTIPAGTRGAKGSAGRFAEPGVNSRPPEYKVYDGTRNIRDVWTIATSPFPEAHFATFPPELPERCIKAGTSERGCCPGCAAPWNRIVKKQLVPTAKVSWGSRPDDRDAGADAQDQGSNRMKDGHVPGMAQANVTLGWSPTCDCSPADPVPCMVLDCFGGAGTTAVVSERLGRDSILIELNPEYCAMAQRRIDAAAGRLRIEGEPGLFAGVAAD